MKARDLFDRLQRFIGTHGGDVDLEDADLGDLPAAPASRVPTAVELVAEIEHGPLAAFLAPHWRGMFVAPEIPAPDPTTAYQAWLNWQVKTTRAGLLTPDAAFEIQRLLADRAKALGWDLSRLKVIQYAKRGEDLR